MRIALLHAFVWPEVRRGAERYVDDLAWYLGRHGHEVDVIAAGMGPGWREDLEGGARVRRHRHLAPVRLQRFGVTPLETFGLIAAADLAVHRYDAVHAMVPSAALAAKTTGQRAIYTMLGHPTRGHLGRRWYEPALYRGAARAVDAVTALSRASAAQVTDLLGREAEVLPPGVRMDRFPLAPAPRTGPPVVLFSADAGDPRKGIHFLMAAFGRLLDRFPEATLRISGVGSHEWAIPGLGDDGPRILDRVEALGTGAPEDVPRRYREASVTVLPSLNEAFGLALVESLASGTPVVCADHGGMPEIVDRHDIGRTFPYGDVVALAEAIEEVVELAAHPATPARCRAHAANWGWDEAVGASHERLYERIAR